MPRAARASPPLAPPRHATRNAGRHSLGTRAAPTQPTLSPAPCVPAPPRVLCCQARRWASRQAQGRRRAVCCNDNDEGVIFLVLPLCQSLLYAVQSASGCRARAARLALKYASARSSWSASLDAAPPDAPTSRRMRRTCRAISPVVSSAPRTPEHSPPNTWRAVANVSAGSSVAAARWLAASPPPSRSRRSTVVCASPAKPTHDLLAPPTAVSAGPSRRRVARHASLLSPSACAARRWLAVRTSPAPALHVGGVARACSQPQ